MDRIPLTELGAWPLRVPDRSTQDAIAEVLGALDDKSDANRRLADSSEELAVALAESCPARVPVRELARVERRQERPADFAMKEVDHFSLPAFDATRLPDRSPGTRIKSGKIRLGGPAVLVSKLNPHIPRVWHAVPGAKPALASTEFVVLIPAATLSSQELWAACACPGFTRDLAEFVTGTTGSHQRVRPEDVLDMEVSDLRQAPESSRNAVRTLVERAGAARRESVVLHAVRDTLLPVLMSGQLHVRAEMPSAVNAT
ncbi:MAG: restriction endonuclease subunit S [Actinomycetes bacterium]